MAVVGALHQMIYSQLLDHGPDRLLGIIDDVVEIAVAFLTVRMPGVPVRRPAPARRTQKRDASTRHDATRRDGSR
jgi:hypothetical protein